MGGRSDLGVAPPEIDERLSVTRSSCLHAAEQRGEVLVWQPLEPPGRGRTAAWYAPAAQVARYELEAVRSETSRRVETPASRSSPSLRARTNISMK